jgi:RNAse (barnase) inhibitor barstar
MTTFLGRHADLERLLETLRARGVDVRVVRAAGDKAEILDAFAEALRLPDWFGRNWDALVDALRDLDGRGGRPVEIVWDQVRSVREQDRDTYATVLDILEQVADERDDLGVTIVSG